MKSIMQEWIQSITEARCLTCICQCRSGSAVHPCAAVAAKTLARRRHGKKNQDFYENLENEKIAKTSKKFVKIDKNIDFGGARNKRTWPANSTRKTTYIDLFSCLYDRKWSKTLPVHVRKRSYVSVRNCMNACVFYVLVLHIGVGSI